jgi:PAS domain S-box-containing protein
LVTDEHAHLTLMNPAAEVMTGWTLDDLRGKLLPDFFAVCRATGEHHIEDPLDHVLRSGEVIHGAMHLSLTTRGSQTIPIAYSAAPIRDTAGAITGGVLVFRDESERRRIELALRNADRQKDEFLATLAHELRNPLAPIRMGVDLLQMPGQDPEVKAQVCAMMARQSQHMVRLIDDLLDVSRITRGKLELRKCQIALDEVVQNAVDANRQIIDRGRLQLVTTLPMHRVLLYADPSRLTQVFSNLLNNAAKFTPADGRIELSAESHGANVTVTVTDSGIGIPGDKKDYIFEMFTQIGGDNPTEGLGIGLTLVKRLVEMHGGAVSVESAGHNLGSQFRVQLPIIPQELSAPEAPVKLNDAIHSARRRVLIVDDNQDALTSLSMVVRALGSETFDAHDGLEAIESAKTFRPDVILMDIGMPRLNGYDAARRIRQEPWGRDVLMVATTGWGKEEDRQRSKNAGFDFHLVKPIAVTTVQELLSTPNQMRAKQHGPLPAVEPG